MEWVSTRFRAIKSIAVGFFYTFGQFILPGLAYAIPQWRWLQLTVSVPFLTFFLLSWYVAPSSSAPLLRPTGARRENPCLTRLADFACPETPCSRVRKGIPGWRNRTQREGALRGPPAVGNAPSGGGAMGPGCGQHRKPGRPQVLKDWTRLLFVTKIHRTDPSGRGQEAEGVARVCVCVEGGHKAFGRKSAQSLGTPGFERESKGKLRPENLEASMGVGQRS